MKQKRHNAILEIIEECRRNISPDFPIVLRVSGSEREPGGNSLDEMLYLAPKFEAAGVDMLEVSAASNMRAFRTSFLLTARRSA